MLSPSTLSLSLTAGVTTVFACCTFSASTTLTVSCVRDVRDPVVLPDDFPVQHHQRFTKITGRTTMVCFDSKYSFMMPFSQFSWCLGPPDMKSSPRRTIQIPLSLSSRMHMDTQPHARTGVPAVLWHMHPPSLRLHRERRTVTR